MKAIAGLVISSVICSGALAAPECKLDVDHPIMVPANSRDAGDTTKRVYKLMDKSAIVFLGRMEIDADGSPHAYAPDNKGLDDTKNAGSVGHWFALATDALDCGPSGQPLVQKAGDPAPGFYVSRTTLTSGERCNRPSTYVDAENIPYVALSPKIANASCAARMVIVGKDDKIGLALHADNAPSYGIGEGSIALAKTLGISSDPRHGGLSTRDLVYVVLEKHMGFPDDADEVRGKVQKAFDKWGGRERLNACKGALAKVPK